VTASGVLEGRRVLVTGASSGIGEAVARAATEAGARVALLARRSGRVDALAGDLPGSVALSADVTDHRRTEAEIDRGADTLGGLDAVVNNAGVMVYGSPASTDPADWQAMLDTNVLGLLAVTRAAVPYLRQAVGPSIVNVSSMGGRKVPLAGSGVYAATKFAVHALGDALRMELQAEGIRVTTLAPGFVDTPLTESWPEGRPLEWWKANAKRGLRPEHVASAAVHLLALPPEVTVVEYALTATTQLPLPTIGD
jgi:clavulanate-9-aldehyde reducatase